MKKRLTAWVLAAVILLAGCANGGAAEQVIDDTEKYNAYIELMNFVDGWFGGMLQSYFGVMGEDAEPSFDGDFERMFATFADFDMMDMHGRFFRSARHHAENAPDWGAADARMLDFADAVEAAMYLHFVEMTDYYNNARFEADNFQQGRDMHVRLIVYIEAMWLAFDDFWMAFQPILVERQGSDLPIFEEYALMIHFYALRLLLTGAEISNRADEPISALSDLIALFVDDLAAMETYNTPEQRALEGISASAAPHVNNYIMHAQRLATLLKDAQNAGRNISAAQIDRELSLLVGQYNIILSL